MPSSVPFFRQAFDFTCGPAAIRIVYAHFVRDLGKATLYAQMDVHEERGTERAEIVRMLRALELEVTELLPARWDDLRTHLRDGRLLIVNYVEPTDDAGHYSVVVGCDEATVVLHDPWNGPGFTLSREVFEARWRGGDDPNPWAVAVCL